MGHVLFPGARGCGKVCARVHGRKTQHAATGNFPAGVTAWPRLVILSTSVADAGLLGISHGVHGIEPADGDLPGAVQPISGKSRAEASDRRKSMGVFG